MWLSVFDGSFLNYFDCHAELVVSLKPLSVLSMKPLVDYQIPVLKVSVHWHKKICLAWLLLRPSFPCHLTHLINNSWKVTKSCFTVHCVKFWMKFGHCLKSPSKHIKLIAGKSLVSNSLCNNNNVGSPLFTSWIIDSSP